MMENWKWIECPNHCIGQRADPKLLKMGAIPYCPECNSVMEVDENV